MYLVGLEFVLRLFDIRDGVFTGKYLFWLSWTNYYFFMADELLEHIEEAILILVANYIELLSL